MVSLNIIASHSPESFRNLIDSAIHYVGEIVVALDEPCSDGIRGYREGKVRYFDRKLAGNYSAQRNFLITQSKGDWIFVLDTDEMLPQSLWLKINDLASSSTDDVIVFPRNNIIKGVCERWMWPDSHYRLFRNTMRYEGVIHERLTPHSHGHRLPETDDYAIIHTKTALDQRNAIAAYSGIQGHKQCILLFEWKRPHYLRVCVDSLSRCNRIQEWPIYLSIDGPKYFTEFSTLFNRVSHVVPWDEHSGNLWHVVRSLDFVLQCGMDRILFLDGDCILRADALTSIPDKWDDDMFLSMVRNDNGPEHTEHGFMPLGNVVTASKLKPILDYCHFVQWVGKPQPISKIPMTCDYDSYDAVFFRYMLDNKRTTRFRDKSYLGHIGACGVDYEDKAIESQLFAGPESEWLENAIRLFKTVKHRTFVPTNFCYED